MFSIKYLSTLVSYCPPLTFRHTLNISLTRQTLTPGRGGSGVMEWKHLFPEPHYTQDALLCNNIINSRTRERVCSIWLKLLDMVTSGNTTKTSFLLKNCITASFCSCFRLFKPSLAAQPPSTPSTSIVLRLNGAQSNLIETY